jgi:hypothetical protein
VCTEIDKIKATWRKRADAIKVGVRPGEGVMRKCNALQFQFFAAKTKNRKSKMGKRLLGLKIRELV